MRRLLPAIYALIIVATTAALAWRYRVDPPAPTSAFSVNLGWVGLISMVVMLIYSVARRSRKLREIARLSAWLHFHIFLGVLGFVCVVFHSMHLFTRDYGFNFLNPAVLNFCAVAVVFCSGLFGRYLYGYMPDSKIFQRWIVLHRPLALIMYVLSGIHVVLSYMYAMAFTAE